MSEGNKNPQTIKIQEDRQQEPAQPEVKAAPKRETGSEAAQPLNPDPSSFPAGTEPAMEGAQGDAEEEEEPQQASALAEELAPEAIDSGTSETDEVLEELRNLRNDRNIDDPAEDSELDLETNQIIVGPNSSQDLIDLLTRLYPNQQVYVQARNDPDSMLSHCIAAADHGWGTTQNEDISKCLKSPSKVADKRVVDRLRDQQDKTIFPGIKDGRPSRLSHKSIDMAGRDAIIAIKARLGGILRVNLLNSGFWVALRSPELTELQEMFATIDFENKNIGRIMGGHFALVTDMYLKRKFVDLLVQKQIIFESNLKGIYKAGTLTRNLAYNDYDTLIHGVVMLMTRGGLRYRCICPKCGHDSIETLDVGACKFVNEDLWTDEVKQWWNTTVDVEGKLLQHNDKDLAEYRNKLIKKTAKFTNVIDNGLGEKVTMELILTEPTMQKYFEVGSRLIERLNKTIDSISTGEEDRAEIVRSSLAIHNHQLMAPWVDYVQLVREDGTIELRSSDPDAILSYLDETSQHDKRLSETLTQFIADTRFNWIGTHSIQCPKCGERPTAAMDNFYPLEVQTVFFGLSSRLWQAGR